MNRIRITAFVGAALALTFGAAGKAAAQAQDFPAVAIIDFSVNSSRVDVPELGAMSAAAVRTEFGRLGSADVVPNETINRTIMEMGWQTPPTDRAGMIRLGQNLNVDTMITGEVRDARIYTSGSGRQAKILVALSMHDVASGLVINGAQTIGSSGVRTGEVATSSLYQDAINGMAFDAVREMANRALPSATVLNTLRDQALINRGSRSGFRGGQNVIIIRGRDQVGNATISQVDADSAFINFGTLIKGVQPGDKVRTLYTPERIIEDLGSSGEGNTRRGARGGSNSGLVSLLLVVLALAFLLGQGRGSNATLASVTAQATITASDQPGVVVSWTRDPFVRGNNEGPYRWQVWRVDGGIAPVAVADGSAGFIVDDAVGSNAPNAANPWYDLITGANTECNDSVDDEGQTTAGNILVPGTPYQYAVELIYRVSGLSLPGTSTGGGGTTGGTTGLTTGGGTTGGGTTTATTTTTTGGTGGTTTGGTTTGGGTTGQTSEWCYFRSQRINAKGIATPVVRPELRSPDPDQIVMTPITFQFSSVRGPVVSAQFFYVIQLSTSPAFPKGNQTVTLTEFIELTQAGGQTVSSPTIDTTSFFPGSIDVFWRVGVRNPLDVPGPVKDPSGNRYIYSAVRRFKRSGIPPLPRSGGG
jgi:hypothetical protein